MLKREPGGADGSQARDKLVREALRLFPPVGFLARQSAQACTLRDGYWLYVVFDCASPAPRLLRVRNPFGRLMARLKESVVLDAASILQAAEE